MSKSPSSLNCFPFLFAHLFSHGIKNAALEASLTIALLSFYCLFTCSSVDCGKIARAKKSEWHERWGEKKNWTKIATPMIVFYKSRLTFPFFTVAACMFPTLRSPVPVWVCIFLYCLTTHCVIIARVLYSEVSWRCAMATRGCSRGWEKCAYDYNGENRVQEKDQRNVCVYICCVRAAKLIEDMLEVVWQLERVRAGEQIRWFINLKRFSQNKRGSFEIHNNRAREHIHTQKTMTTTTTTTNDSRKAGKCTIDASDEKNWNCYKFMDYAHKT